MRVSVQVVYYTCFALTLDAQYDFFSQSSAMGSCNSTDAVKSETSVNIKARVVTVAPRAPAVIVREVQKNAPAVSTVLQRGTTMAARKPSIASTTRTSSSLSDGKGGRDSSSVSATRTPQMKQRESPQPILRPELTPSPVLVERAVDSVTPPCGLVTIGSQHAHQLPEHDPVASAMDTTCHRVLWLRWLAPVNDEYSVETIENMLNTEVGFAACRVMFILHTEKVPCSPRLHARCPTSGHFRDAKNIGKTHV